ncbi:acetamidase/formamidase family protein [Paraburkholderia ultramafica]|uniref:acetamidase/formamidase family protein n=1 Tax=Paraburkholderia ultramafica TaxID=1544867 RepID=UPI001FE993F7|nr:acetamidase/formamidase family protein [Paraburkholderia ultramafica]
MSTRVAAGFNTFILLSVVRIVLYIIADHLTASEPKQHAQPVVNSTVDDIARLDFARANPVVGPMYIDGAEPGDAVKVTLLSCAPSGWGSTANIPDFGLLADKFHGLLHHRVAILQRGIDPGPVSVPAVCGRRRDTWMHTNLSLRRPNRPAAPCWSGTRRCDCFTGWWSCWSPRPMSP